MKNNRKEMSKLNKTSTDEKIEMNVGKKLTTDDVFKEIGEFGK